MNLKIVMHGIIISLLVTLNPLSAYIKCDVSPRDAVMRRKAVIVSGVMLLAMTVMLYVHGMSESHSKTECSCLR